MQQQQQILQSKIECVVFNLPHAAALNAPNPSQVVLNSVKPLRTHLRRFSSSSAKALISSIATSELICNKKKGHAGSGALVASSSLTKQETHSGHATCEITGVNFLYVKTPSVGCSSARLGCVSRGISKPRLSRSIQSRFEQLMIG